MSTLKAVLSDVWTTSLTFLAAVLFPALHLWPWLFAAAAYLGFLTSSQGLAVSADMTTSSFLSGQPLALVTSFLGTLVAGLFTSMVVTSSRRPAGVGRGGGTARRGRIGPRWVRVTHVRLCGARKFLGRGRTQGALHIAWGFALASTPAVALVLTGGPQNGAWYVLATAAASAAALYALLKGAWRDPSSWAARMGLFHRWRFVLGALVALAAVMPLHSAAAALEKDPLSLSALGPAFTAMVGLSALASLVGACFVALPHCLPWPRLAVLLPVLVVWFNVCTQPLVDAENPLLATKTAAAQEKVGAYAALGKCGEYSDGELRAVLDHAARVRRGVSKNPATPSLTFVSAEGGGIRAAYWTSMSLWNLSMHSKEFVPQVASMSGVSGGSLGIAAWLAAIEATVPGTDDSGEVQRRLIEDFLGTDFVSPAIAGLLFLDAPRLLFGEYWFKLRRDDVFAAALVYRWEQVAAGTQGKDFFLRPIQHLCFLNLKHPPLLYFNSTDALHGNLISFGNTREGWAQGGRTGVLGPGISMSEMLRPTRGLPRHRPETVVEAVVTSARFTFLAPTSDVGVALESLEYLMRESSRVAASEGAASQSSPATSQASALGTPLEVRASDEPQASSAPPSTEARSSNEQARESAPAAASSASSPPVAEAQASTPPWKIAPSRRGAVASAPLPASTSAPASAAPQARFTVLVDGGYFDNSGLVRTRQALTLVSRETPERPMNDIVVNAVHIWNDPSRACFPPPDDWVADASVALKELVKRTGFRAYCRSEIDELEEMLEARPWGWLTSPIQALFSVRLGQAIQEREGVGALMRARKTQGRFVELSLSEQMSEALCGRHPSSQDRKACYMRASLPPRETVGGPLDPVRVGKCPNLPQDPPLPLGWALSSRDQAWMGCLAELGVVRALSKSEAEERFFRQREERRQAVLAKRQEREDAWRGRMAQAAASAPASAPVR